MSNENKLFLLIAVFVFVISHTIAKDDSQDVTTENPEWTPWSGFIPCQYSPNSSYFCPKEKTYIGSCSSPPAANDYYCTDKGYCQCDYDYNYSFIYIILIVVMVIVVGLVSIIFCICYIHRTRRRARNVARAKTYEGSLY